MRSRWFILALLSGGGLVLCTNGSSSSGLLCPASAAPPTSGERSASPPAVDPRDDRIQRRAIRGGPLDLSRESPELRELRSFEEESFPRANFRPGGGQNGGDAAGAVPLPQGGGPDALPEGLRSPVQAHSDPSAPPERPTIPWLQALKLLDNLGLSPTFVRFESHVIRYLEFYKEERRGRSIMASWLRKQGRYRALIEQALDRHSMPRFLLYVAMIESGYDPHDRSNKGAVGLWQFMPEGARIYGLRVDYWVDERKDPIRSTDAAARYLGDLKARFGSWHMALAAFNAGYGAVLRAMQKYNTNDYWELCRHEDGLPWETLNYVPKAIATAVVGENRGFFGYDDVAPEPSLQFDTVTVSTSLGFDKIARVVSSTPEELARLNPELRRGRTPPLAAGETWTLRLPPGTAGAFLAQLDTLRRSEQLVAHVVRFGERIDDLARERGVSASTLRRINGIEERESAEVRAGLTLLVPATTEKSRASGSSSSTASSDELTIVAVPDKNLSVHGKKRVFYRVIPGDSIWAIARFFKVKDADLLRWNNLDPEATLATRLVLDIWVDPDFDTSQVVLVDPARVRVVTTGSDEFFELVETLRGRKRIFHVCKPGDTLERLAKKYNFTVADLERINRIGRQTDLQPGQKIVVYLTMTAAERSAALARLRGETVVDAPDAPASAADEKAPEKEGAKASEKGSDDGATRSGAGSGSEPATSAPVPEGPPAPDAEAPGSALPAPPPVPAEEG